MYASRLETQSHYVLSHSFSWQLVFMRVCCSLAKLPPGLTSSQQDSRCLGHQRNCLLALSRLPCTQVSPHILFSQAHLLSPRFGTPQKPFPQPRRTAQLGYLQDLWHKHQARCFFYVSSWKAPERDVATLATAFGVKRPWAGTVQGSVMFCTFAEHTALFART